jgi:histidine triad (HIT) family protein
MTAHQTDHRCLFCRIAAGELPAAIVYRNENVIAFLDISPLFAGHVLLCPTEHYATLPDVPVAQVGPFFEKAQMLTKAVEAACEAEGTFLAINNRVSQTVPHLHLHIVPRRRKDGLRGFFWPRTKYGDANAIEEVRQRIEQEALRLDAKIESDA